MSGDASVRAFVALELDPPLRQALGELQARLGPTLGGIRLVKPEGIHLTLRFLGQTSPAQVLALGPPLAAAARACPRLEARVAGAGTFPDRGSPRVLWLGVELPPAALELQRACEQAAPGVGLRAGAATVPRPPDARSLARARRRVPRCPRPTSGRRRSSSLVLFRSETAPAGAVYTPLARFELGGA